MSNIIGRNRFVQSTLVFAGLCAFGAGSAWAETATGELFVTAELNYNSCTVPVSVTLNFTPNGGLTPAQRTAFGEATIDVDCLTDSTAWSIKFLDANNDVDGVRQLTGPDGSDGMPTTIEYRLYTLPGELRPDIIGGDPSDNEKHFENTGTDTSFTVFGKIDMGSETFPDGIYTDTVQYRITF